MSSDVAGCLVSNNATRTEPGRSSGFRLGSNTEVQAGDREVSIAYHLRGDKVASRAVIVARASLPDQLQPLVLGQHGHAMFLGVRQLRSGAGSGDQIVGLF